MSTKNQDRRIFVGVKIHKDGQRKSLSKYNNVIFSQNLQIFICLNLKVSGKFSSSSKITEIITRKWLAIINVKYLRSWSLIIEIITAIINVKYIRSWSLLRNQNTIYLYCFSFHLSSMLHQPSFEHNARDSYHKSTTNRYQSELNIYSSWFPVAISKNFS